MLELTQHIAATLQLLRKQRSWSLDKTAQATGVSKAMLGQIERGESSPTVATLWKIATGFQTSFSTFLETSQQTTMPNSIGGFAEISAGTDPDISAKALIPYDSTLGFELLQVSLPAGIEHFSDAHACGVMEHAIPLNDMLEVLIDGKWQAIGQGDVIRFDASKPHGYRNLSANTVMFHNLICYPRTNIYTRRT